MKTTTPSREEVRDILRRCLPSEDYRAVLFGSRARGGEHGRASDWDIGILGPTRLHGAVVQRIREELEALRTLHTFDVVDLSAVPESFRADVLAEAEPLT